MLGGPNILDENKSTLFEGRRGFCMSLTRTEQSNYNLIFVKFSQDLEINFAADGYFPGGFLICPSKPKGIKLMRRNPFLNLVQLNQIYF